jgi:hypothetical protein
MRIKCSHCGESVYGTILMDILKEHITTCDITPEQLLNRHMITITQYQELVELGR